ncbi:cyclodeaminase/cyclohydrolase family protein [Candidatus Bipolaricaulota bacterium]|nr:cyclodeaminase/cyclohydrolase family protein [Candidatus Bipolaricaulota bacterium]
MRAKQLAEFLSELSSSSPTPGGGAAAALAGAMAAALAGMVAELAARRGDEVSHTIAKAGELREELLSLAQRDVEAYDRVAAALRLPKGTPEEAEARRVALQAALRGAAEVPLSTAKLTREVLTLAREFVPHCPKSARSDLASAGALALAAVEAALCNVDANCLGIKDPGFLEEMAKERSTIAAEAAAAAEALRSALEPDLQRWLPA